MIRNDGIRIGQIFRVPYRGQRTSTDALVSYLDLTRGVHAKPADKQKGMFFFEQIHEPGQEFDRLPAFVFHSNPFKRGGEVTPWVDIIEPDVGYCLFHGDNRKPGFPPLASRGNARFMEVQHFYADPALRRFAPPILVFEQVEFRGSRTGYRQFCGVGVPIRYSLATQKEKRGEYFTNLVIELVLFRLDKENEIFSWHWIDQRRNSAVDAETALKAAPASWRKWVSGGELAIEGCRRFVARQSVVDPARQGCDGNAEHEILQQVQQYFTKKRHSFEGVASFVAQKVLGPQCRRGWVTKRSGDGGVDFVCRLDVGDPVDRLSHTAAVVLGQAKCVAIGSAVGGHALARVVARLQRGWLGVFVTTGVFSRAAQLELAQDKYPIVLINGRRLAGVLFEVVTKERIALRELLDRETEWYLRSERHLTPQRILEDAFWFEMTAS
jgi:hypothetical protein